MANTTPVVDAGLRVFTDPVSVAVVGASADPAKWGYWLAQGALKGRDRRDVFLLNRGGAPILGTRSYRTLAELPSVPELVALCVPPTTVGAVVDEALALGVRGFLGITAGVPEEAEIGTRIRAAGARLVGMNSLGIFDASTDLQLAWGEFTPGAIAIVSQSGQLGSEVAALAARAGLGVSRFFSIGNQTDVAAVELLDDLAGDPCTKVVALYLESFAGGPELIAAISRLRAAGKHTILLTVGGSAASTRLARSHTGSMTSALDVVDAAARAAGAVRVQTPTEIVQVARLLMSTDLPAGDLVAVVGDSGGQTGIAADVASMSELQVAAFSEALSTTLADVLPGGASCSNPVDLAGAGEQDLATYATVVENLLAADEVDSVLLTGYFGSYGVDTPSLATREGELVERMAGAARAAGKPLLVHSMVAEGPAIDAMWEHGIPAYASIEAAISSLSAVTRLQRSGRQLATPVVETTSIGPGYLAAQQFLHRAGVRFPVGARVLSAEDIEGIVAQLSGPFVLKAAWLEHKSEVGGVAVGLKDLAEVRAAFDVMHANLGDGEYVLEELDRRPNVVEILLGVRRDRDLGPVVVIGAGGVEAEVYRDVAIEMAPVDRETAAAMIARLQCHPLLLGWRGKPAVDIAGLTDLVVAVSELVSAHPGITEIELNPLRVGPDGTFAVDALIIEK
ncbi:acetate--CoA ligase family protein [Rhodococcus sp. IEGM 1366]|uniref:acetate--CoA ligase family protein n=1 Tax=Rhodococcus sp. IEGM 1366 TaxID=3082223 RepID=UPI002955A31E|nr:acetate--CoA ligase family protein [Rhodococcus sp. IEGM 1366]MDV8070706.1 acetate--CoA ligase family protein [Rhodococcus sp. IEGM 1366]